MYLADVYARSPVVPYVRECDFAVRKPWKMGNRRLLDYLLIYVHEGECEFGVDGEDHLFRSGEFCLIQPNSMSWLEGRTSTITPYMHLDIFYHAGREDSFPTRAGQIDLSPYEHLMQPRLNDMAGIHIPIRLQLSQPIPFRDRLLELIQCWQKREPLYVLKVQSLATQLVVSILEDHMQAGRPSARTEQSMLNWITSYFSFNLSEKITIDEMAKRANLSPSRFSAVFKEQYGMAPHQYVIDLRIRHAKELLRTTELPLKQVAEYCGFADIHHFSKMFKSKSGASPQQFRTAAHSYDLEEL